MNVCKFEQIDINNINYNKNINYNDFRQIVKNSQFKCIYNQHNITFIEYSKLQTDDFELNSNDAKLQANDYTNDVIFLKRTDFIKLIMVLYKDFVINFCKNTRINNKTVKNFNFQKFKFYIVIITIIFSIFFFTNSIISIFLKGIIVSYYEICFLIKNIIIISSIYNLKKTSSQSINEEIDKFTINIKNEQENITTQSLNNQLNLSKLPIYTILIPMYHENINVIQQWIKSIQEINYPKNLLDIIFVLEEDDLRTQKELENVKLPDFVTTVLVPYFEPRTKPKACNVASLFAKGEFLVVFDAEDIPDKDQLLKAVEKFNNNNINILQCNLHFYNHGKNLLTSCFEIEYLVWFKYILHTLSYYDIITPLGGTSNHIRYSFLEKLNYWDSYNVTEDLELSICVNKMDDKINCLDSDTLEWCVEDLKAFLKQRTRWIKGYILSYLTHFSDYHNCHNNNLKKIICFNVIIGFQGIAYLLSPLMLTIIIQSNFYIKTIITGTSCTYYVTYIYLYCVLSKKNNLKITKTTISSFIIFPIYFTLHTISSYIAIFEILRKPFYWSKTVHNIN